MSEELKLDSYGESKDKAAGKAKRGALSSGEMQFIKDNCKILDIDEISKKIGKSISTIRKYAYKANLPIKENGKELDSDRFLKTRKILRSRQYYKDMKNQFSDEEIKAFEELWVKIYLQFDGDILTTEDLQVKKHITLDILKDRFLKKGFLIEKQIENAQKSLDEEYSKPKGTKNLTAIKDLTSVIDKLQRTGIDINKEINSIVDKIKDTEKALKGSREQRVKEFVDAEKNWTNTLRLLENPEIREQVGKHIELMRAAQDKQRDKLYDWHTFANGQIDRVILNADSVILEEE